MATIVTKSGAMTALLSGVLATSLQAQSAWAQEAPPPPPPPAVEAPPPPPPEPTPPPPAAAPVVATPAPAATVATEAPKHSFKKMDPPGIWFRLDNRFQSKDPTNMKKLNGFVMGSEVDVLFSGSVHEYVAWQADFVATFGNQSATGKDITGSAAVLDLIGKFQLHDSFNIWVGRMLVPSDRSNFSGPWFMSAWNYPGFYGAPALGGAPLGPRQGPFGRNDGATVWGQFMGGYAKYYLSAFDLHTIESKALVSGRLNFSVLSPEPGYYHSSTYYGGKDIVALGLFGQYQKGGSVAPIDPMAPAGSPVMSEDYSQLGADLLAEKKFGDAGTGTVEGAFYKFNGKYEPAKNGFYALASYLIPMEVGIGRFQPLVRLQQAKSQTAKTWRLIDAAVSYVVDEYAMRIALNYQNADIEGTKANSVTLGIQIQK